MECANYSRFMLATGTAGANRLWTGRGRAARSARGSIATAARSAAFPNFAPRANRVIFLFQAGGPSHLDLLDYKPQMKGRFDQDIPPSIFGGQRVTGMVAQQDRFPVVPTMYGFRQYGQSGRWLSDLLPHTGKIADEICVLRRMHTEAINHDPAITLIQTGSQLAGPAVHGLVDRLRAGQRESEPAMFSFFFFFDSFFFFFFFFLLSSLCVFAICLHGQVVSRPEERQHIGPRTGLARCRDCAWAARCGARGVKDRALRPAERAITGTLEHHAHASSPSRRAG